MDSPREPAVVGRNWSVLERLDATDVHGVCRDLHRHRVRSLARLVDVPEVVLAGHDSAAKVIRRRLRRHSPSCTVQVAHLLTEPTRDIVVAALGAERSDDPSVDDLLEVLPEAVDAHGVPRVALLLALAVDDEWPAAKACTEIFETDPRFALDALGPVVDDDAAPTSRTTPARQETDDSVKEQRRARKKHRRAKAADRSRPRARYRKARTSDGDTGATTPGPEEADPGAGIPEITGNGEPVLRDQHQRRAVRIVHARPDLDRTDPLVGRVVFANIRYIGPIKGEKPRPCVVLAASGPHHLVVRTCYSEGGRRADDFRSVEISDLELAGLDRPTFVNYEERRIPRTAVKWNLGWLPIADWNQL